MREGVRPGAVHRPIGWLGLLALAVGSLSGVSCHTVNYLDAQGPVYSGGPAAPSPLPATGVPLRVVTFNIAFGRKIDRALEVLREAEPLRRPDVLCLQEMDAPGVERIARELQMSWVYYPSAVHPKTGRDFGCAILSPWRLVEPAKVELPFAATWTGIRRSVVRATLERGSERVRVYSVHLPSPLGLGEERRRKQVAVLLDDAERSEDPVVIAGDFNSGGIGKVLEREGYTWVTRDLGPTVRFLFFGVHFDHVFTRGLVVSGEEPHCGVVKDNRDASDHRPVWAILSQPPAAAGGPARPSADGTGPRSLPGPVVVERTNHG